MTIYRDDRDRREFLDLLGQVFESHSVECHAYCLMSNHYHLVFTTRRANLSDTVKQLNGTYAQRWNERHGRTGHVFQSRFHAQVVENSAYLLTVCRYVVLNPVRAGLVRAPEDWPWSSCAATASIAARPTFLRPEIIWRHFSETDLQRAVERYADFVHAADPDTAKPGCQSVLGDLAFVAQFDGFRERASREVPQRDRALRPQLETLFAGAIARDRRNAQAAKAYALGYSMVDIAHFLGMHSSTVSIMIRAAKSTAKADEGLKEEV